MTPTDDELVERISVSEPTALAELMRRYGPSLMRFATHFLRSADEADEVLQEVFLRAERAIRRGTRPTRLEGWLFRIAVNRCRSRRRRWWPFVSGAVADQAMARVATQPDDDTMALREELALGIAALSPPLREAFLLKHVEGMEYQEISAATGVGVSALKMRVARACEQLRGRLGEIR